MPEYESLSPDIQPDEIDVRITRLIIKQTLFNIEKYGSVGFFFNDSFYSGKLTPEIITQLKAGNEVVIKATKS